MQSVRISALVHREVCLFTALHSLMNMIPMFYDITPAKKKNP